MTKARRTKKVTMTMSVHINTITMQTIEWKERPETDKKLIAFDSCEFAM